MRIVVGSDSQEMGRLAATTAADTLRTALQERGAANLILATGASQFEMLQELVKADLNWGQITCFHLDEYIGLDDSHPASFRRYLRERFVEQVDGLKEFHWVSGDNPDSAAECERLGAIIEGHPIDLACIGIGENGHLAFNDPPADFETTQPYLVVELDEACRRQQSGEGWFATLADVPTRAISMSVGQIMKSATIVCTVPDERKAKAVQAAVEGAVTPDVPASILNEHANATLFVDTAAAALLTTSKPGS
ncbi:MAG: glucosamine-6-phosphate deaminase [Bythopirellula sp.]